MMQNRFVLGFKTYLDAVSVALVFFSRLRVALQGFEIRVKIRVTGLGTELTSVHSEIRAYDGVQPQRIRLTIQSVVNLRFGLHGLEGRRFARRLL